MTSQVTDVLAAVQSFVAKGYDREYGAKDGNLVDLELGSTLDPCTIHVDAALRLESGNHAEDASNICAITDPAARRKGLLIYALDVFDQIHRDLSGRLVAHRETAPAGDQNEPSKLGLRKVYKNDFHRNPERYVQREGFSDVPPCPFGGDFGILGFDTPEHEYVWLVTSIIRDPTLIRAPYQGEDVINDE
jgi:hypothetical protein